MARTPKYNSLVASAEMIRGAKLRERQVDSINAGNEEVWKYYDGMGELTFGVTWFANTLSRIRLTAAKSMTGGEEPMIVTGGPPAELVAAIAGGIGGQSRLMWSFGNFLPLTGDMYLVGETNNEETAWRAYPPEGIRVRNRRGTQITEVQIDDSRWRPLPIESFVVRVWREHPRRWWHAQSPARTALPILGELELINRHIVAVLQSRLAGAGILVVPTEVTFAPSPQHADAPDPFVAELIDVMTTPIKDPGSASAVVPMVVRMPAQFAEALKHIDFATELDRKILNMRESAIQRLATTLDLPAEVLLGLGTVNHWSAWAVTEDAFKSHVAPAVELVCDALTKGYLHPTMEALGLDTTDWVVWYDNSEVTTKPDHSENVIAAYDRYEANGTALRREIGLDQSDAPDEEELRIQALKKMLNHPVAAELAARELGVLRPETRAIGADRDDQPGVLEPVGGRPPNGESPAAPADGVPTTPPRNGAG